MEHVATLPNPEEGLQADQYQHLFPVDGLESAGSGQLDEGHKASLPVPNPDARPEPDGQTVDVPKPPEDDLQKQVETDPQPDASSPSNMELEDSTKDGVEDGAIDGVVQEPPFPSEYDRLNKVVEENPEDFNGWVYLLQYVEQENHLAAARKAFDAFFLRYPYCYGYWKKYADIEKKNGCVQVADEVYRRGLQAIPLSVDLWLHYITFLKENQDNSDGEAENRIRATYEHAVLAAGTDFRSDRLWEAYITWETEQEKLANVTAIYDRILGIPTQLYSQHFQKFKDHIQNNHPKHFLSEEEFVQMRVELAASSLSGTDGETPAEDLPPGTEDLPDPAKVIETRQEVFNHNEHEVSKRWAFEEGIKRPYFHVKALEKTQLTNWREYLDFELENGTPERVVVLFERCLIACALYEEFWMKYAKYLESYSIEGVRHIYKKACSMHLPKKPTVHLLWAAFEEQQANVEEARSILKNLEEAVPGLAMVRLRRVSLERRHGNLDEAESLLRDAIKNGKNASESSFYAVKLARQLLKVQRSLGKAKKVLLEAIEKDETSPKLYLNLLELEYSGDVQQNEADILACFDRALGSAMPLESRLTFSQRKVEFLEDFGSDVNVSGVKCFMTYFIKCTNIFSFFCFLFQQYNYQNSWGQYNQYAQYNQYYPPPPT
uniref:Pre-mRNA-processing factor 39 n=1 Tax=Denticeps clupeoides TaxID=299321 RepID=A0AAY4BWA4_9TELE